MKTSNAISRCTKFNTDLLISKHGNCAEMNAFALVEHHQINCRGSLVAAYGLQKRRLTFMPPCRDRDGRWGCASFCKQNQITPITKRSRIEGEPDLDPEQKEGGSDNDVVSLTV